MHEYVCINHGELKNALQNCRGCSNKIKSIKRHRKIVLQQKNNFHRRSEGGSCEKNLMLHETWVEIIK